LDLGLLDFRPIGEQSLQLEELEIKEGKKGRKEL
jgi:hypothetical protein